MGGMSLFGMMGGQPSIEGPGQPINGADKKGPMKGKSALIAGITGPLLSLLASKLSGGALPFTEGLAHFGKGFADTSLQNAKAKRQADFERENQLLDAAHKLITVDIPKLDPLIVQKFPSLGQLSQKYMQALSESSEGGIKITPKEQQEIITQYHLATASMGQATREQEDKDKMGDVEEQQRRETQGFANTLPQAEGVTPEERFGLAQEMQSDLAQKQFEAAMGKAEYEKPQVMKGYEDLGPLTGGQRTTLQSRKISMEDQKARRDLQLQMLRERLGSTQSRHKDRLWMQWQGRRAKYVSDNVSDPSNPDPMEVDKLEKTYEMMDPPPSQGGGGAPAPRPQAGHYDMEYVPGKGLVPAR